MEIVLNYCQYGVLYLGSYYNTGPYIHFPHFGNSNLGKLPNLVPLRVCYALKGRLVLMRAAQIIAVEGPGRGFGRFVRKLSMHL